MGGMAWTLHPALFYERYGSVLVQLWDSGALRAVFRPFRRLSASLGAATSGFRRVSADVVESSSSAVMFSESTLVTEDAALSRADRDVFGTSEEPSTSQCNELAFQGDMYVIHRRQRKQRERLKRMREIRGKAKSSTSTKRRRGGSILGSKSQRKKGKYSRLMTTGTPMADLQGAIPRKSVTMDDSETFSPGSQMESEPEVADFGDTSSAGWLSDDNDTTKSSKACDQKLQCANGITSELRSKGPCKMAALSQGKEVEARGVKDEKSGVIAPSESGTKYSVGEARKKKSHKDVPRDVQEEVVLEPNPHISLIECTSDISKRAISESKQKGRKTAKKTSPFVGTSPQLVAPVDSNDGLSGPLDISRSKRNARKSLHNNGSADVFVEEGQDTPTLQSSPHTWNEHKRKNLKHVQRRGPSEVDPASTKVVSGAGGSNFNATNDVLKSKKKSQRNRKDRGPLGHGGASTKAGISSEPRNSLQVSAEARITHCGNKGKNEMPTELAITGVDQVKPRLDEEWRNPAGELTHVNVSSSKRKNRKGAKRKGAPKEALACLEPEPEAALTDLLSMSLGTKTSKSERSGQRNSKDRDLLKADATSLEHGYETAPANGGLGVRGVDTSKRRNDVHVAADNVGPNEVSMASLKPATEVGSSDFSQYSSTALTNAGVPKCNSDIQRNLRALRSPEIDAPSIEPGIDKGSKRQPQIMATADSSRDKKEKAKGVKDGDSVEDGATLLESEFEPISSNVSQMLTYAKLSMRNGLSLKDTNVIGPPTGSLATTKYESDARSREPWQLPLVPQVSMRDKRQEAFNASSLVFLGNLSPYTLKDFSGVTSMSNKLQTQSKDKPSAVTMADEPGPSGGHFMTTWPNGTNVNPVRTPSVARASLERGKIVANARTCFIRPRGLAAEHDAKPDGFGANLKPAEASATEDGSNDAHALGHTNGTRTGNILGALRRPTLQRSDSDGASLQTEGPQPPNEQWPAWLTIDLDDQGNVSRRLASACPEEERLLQRLATWDPFQEESYALVSPVQLDLTNRKSSDAHLTSRPRQRAKPEASSSTASFCGCNRCPYHTTRSKQFPLHAMKTDPSLYEDLQWMTESTGTSLAVSLEQQFPSALVRPPDLGDATSSTEEHRLLRSALEPSHPQARSKVPAADEIVETLPYTVQHRCHKCSPTSTHAAMDGWGSSSGSCESRSCERSCVVSPEDAQLEHEGRLRSETAIPCARADRVRPSESRAPLKSWVFAMEEPRPEDDTREAPMVTRDVTRNALKTPEAQESSLRRGKVNHAKLHNKRLTMTTEKRKNPETPHDHRDSDSDADADDNGSPRACNVSSATTPASPLSSVNHITKRMDAWRRSTDYDADWAELDFSEPDHVALSSAGELRISINLTTRRKRSMIWPF